MAIILKNDLLVDVKYQTSGENGTLTKNGQAQVDNFEGWVTLTFNLSEDTAYTLTEDRAAD